MFVNNCFYFLLLFLSVLKFENVLDFLIYFSQKLFYVY